MSRNLPIPHQKVQKFYKTLFSDNVTVSNKKGNIRMLSESILNYLLLKHLNIDVDKDNLHGKNLEFSDKLNKLKLAGKVPIIHLPAFHFLHKEGNLGSHSTNNPDDAGEETYVESAIILLKPIIKKFFDEEGLSSDFLNENISFPNMNLTSYSRIGKKTLIYTFTSIFALLLLIATIFIKSLYSDLDSNQEKIDEYLKINSSQNELIKSKQAKIDSLNLIINSSQQKSNINNGIQNDFKGKVDNVTNVGKVDKLEI